jgi:hypothetical protein
MENLKALNYIERMLWNSIPDDVKCEDRPMVADEMRKRLDRIVRNIRVFVDES